MKWKFLFIFFLVGFTASSGFAFASNYDLIIVRADKLPDYGVISPYANTEDIPIIFLKPDEVPGDVEKILKSYQENGYKELLIIGGKSAISERVQQKLEEMGFNTERLWDWNRYGTSGRVAVDLWGKSKEAVITNGEDLKNLLVAQRYSLKEDIPILFTKNGEIPSSTRSAISKIGIEKAYVFGDSVRLDGLGVETVRMNLESIDFEEKPKEGGDFGKVYLLTGFVAILVVISLLLVGYYHKQKNVPYDVFTDDEKEIIDIILDGDEVEQQKLPEVTDFSRPKVSRIIKDLRDRDIIERDRRKKTYILSLKREIEK